MATVDTTVAPPAVGSDDEIAGLIRIGQVERTWRYLKQAWQLRWIATKIPLINFRASHNRTALGFTWTVLTPMFQLGVYFLIFGVLIDANRGLPEGISIPAFLATGIFTFRFMSSTVRRGTNSITGNEALIRSAPFPRVLLPAQSLMTNAYELVPEAIVMFTFVLIMGSPPLMTWLLYPFLMVIAASIAIGLAMISARVNVLFRDWGNFLPFVMRITMYTSGVLFPITRKFDNETFLNLVAINPFYSVVAIARTILLDFELLPSVVISACAWAVVIPVVGLWFFRKGEPTYGS